jgi:hypothetical protein
MASLTTRRKAGNCSNPTGVKPELIANFEYSEMTESGRIIKPAIWKGFRGDKDPKDVMIQLISIRNFFSNYNAGYQQEGIWPRKMDTKP